MHRIEAFPHQEMIGMRTNRLFRRILAGVLAAVLAALCCVGALAAPEDTPAYVRTVFNKSNGLPTDEANTVLQTKDGYLWVGGYGGLLRYDGVNFRNFSTEGAISTPSIRYLFQDSVGRLWIGTSDAGVFVYENGTFTSIPCMEQYGYLSVWGFAEAADGTIYVASTSGVAVVLDNTLHPLDDPQVAGETVYSVAFDAYGRLWCARNTGDVVVLQNDETVAVLSPELFFGSGIEVSCLSQDGDHNIYLGSSGSVLARVTCTGPALDGSDFSIRLYQADDANFHNNIRVMDDGSMLVSGQQGFAWVLPDGQEANPHAAYRTDSVNDAIMDREGNVWLASSKEGLIRYTPGLFGSPNSQAGLTGTDVNAVTEAGGLFYVATDLGVRAFDSQWDEVTNPLTRALEKIQVQTLMTDSSGRLWCGSYAELSVVCYDPADGSILRFTRDNGLNSNNVRTIYEMADGTVAVGTQDGLGLIRDGAVTAFYDKTNGLDTQSVLCLSQTDDGKLLIGSAGGGLYVLESDSSMVNYSFAKGLESGVILRILPDDDGKSGFISAGTELYYWSEKWEDKAFRRLDNLKIGVGSIFDLCLHDGRLWLMQDSGLYSVDKEQLLAGEEIYATHYGVAHGLTGSLGVNTWNYLSADGTLYLATRNGISVYDFRDAPTYTAPLVITGVRLDGSVYDHPDTIYLSKDNRRMTISFSALTYSGSSDLCLAYKLEGFARNETVLSNTTSGSVSYTNLDGGEYTFRLRAFDPDDPTAAESLEIKVIKEKSLTEQPLFWTVCVLVVVLSAFGIAHWVAHTKMMRLRRQRQEYRGIVEQALRTFANTIDAKDPYTNGHSLRVALYSREITRRLGYSENDQETVFYVALLHDIGKIGIPDSILNKAGALTPAERAVIQTHPVKGGEILKDFTALKGIADGARYHHERYDGKGYCEGLAGEDIPLVGRIICVADSYDAMSSDRCYRKALPQEKVLAEIEAGSGTQFDPKIAAIMVDMIYEGAAPVSPADTQLPPPDSAPTPDENTPDKK